MSEIKVRKTPGHAHNADENGNNRSALSKRQTVADRHKLMLLNKLGIELSEAIGTSELYKKIVDAAVAIMESQFGTMQMLYPDPRSSGKLRVVASYGLSLEAQRYWEWVYHYTGSSCGEVLRTRRRVVIPDYRSCEFMKNEPTLQVFLEGGILAAQSTPLYSGSGQLLGMISTHWNAPHTPPEHHLEMLDILAQHAADLVEHTQILVA